MTTDLLTRPGTRLWTPQDPEILDAATRREFLAGLASASLLVACGNGSDTAAAPEAETRTVVHGLGTSEVPIAPDRVIAVHPSTVDTLLSLGLTPVGVNSPAPTFLRERITDRVDSVGEMNSLNLEAIAQLRPDLILGLDLTFEDVYAELSALAPTVGISFESTGDWKMHVAEFAAAIGREEQLAETLDDYRARARSIGARLGSQGAPTIAIAVAGEFPRYELPGIFSGSIVYGDVDLPLPAGLQEAAEAGEAALSVSPEQIVLGDADILVIYTPVVDDPDAVAKFQANPLYEQLNAVANDRVFVVGGHWFNGGPIAANLLLDDLESLLDR